MNIPDTNKSLSKIQSLSKHTPINLVLSGGGVKAAAHIAFLEYLELHNIAINSISGSSAGALVGALYASGKRPIEILNFFKSTPIFRYTWLNPTKAGIFDSSKYEIIISNYLKYNFEELNTPLTIIATNIKQNTPVYFNKGNLISPLLASCAVPAVFSPIEIEGELYSDGGVMDNFPILPFANQYLPIIGSYACQPKRKIKKELNSIYKVMHHTNSLLLHSANSYKFTDTYATVVFPLGDFGTFDTKKIDDIYMTALKYLQMNTAAYSGEY